MKSNQNEPSRWVQTNFPPGVDRTLSDMLRAARDLPVPNGAHLVQPSRALSGKTGLSIGPLRWSLAALVLFLLIGTAGVVAGTRVFRTRVHSAANQATVPPTLPYERPSSPARTLKDLSASTTEPEVVQPQKQLAHVSTQLARNPAKATRHTLPVVENSLDTEPQRSDLREGRALSEIYRLLRAEKNAILALQRLDDFSAAFPASRLQSEAQLARVEALIATSNYGEATRALEHVNPDSSSIRRMVRVTRGELLVKEHNCEQAVVEFDKVIAERVQDVFEERALYGRASCRLESGDIARARSDLARCLERHPKGVRAAKIEKQLQSPM